MRREEGAVPLSQGSPQQLALHVSFGSFIPDSLPATTPKEICICGLEMNQRSFTCQANMYGDKTTERKKKQLLLAICVASHEKQRHHRTFRHQAFYLFPEELVFLVDLPGGDHVYDGQHCST